MSPRSEEFLAGARERLAAARDLLAMSHPATALSAAYYAMISDQLAAQTVADAERFVDAIAAELS